jgi:thymidylate kinase
MDYTIGYLANILPQLVRSSTLILFDRYYHDLLVDTRRYRYGAQLWPVRLVGWFIPRPHLVFLLDAPPTVLHERKQEVSFEEAARQREEYLKLARDLPNGHVVDASKPLDEVVAEVGKTILDHMAKRTGRRLGLG